MDEAKVTANFGLQALMNAGADKAVSDLRVSKKTEMNVESGELSLLRTTFNTALELTAIKDHKKGHSTLNRSDEPSIESAASDVIDILDGAEPDEANDIAQYQEPMVFESGREEPRLDLMYERVRDFLHNVQTKYPNIVIRQTILDFTRSQRYFLNSNGVDFKEMKGIYRCMFVFSAKDGEKVSSFNYTGVSMDGLSSELLDMGSIDLLLNQSGEQLNTQPIKGKFVGDVIVTPDCLDDFVSCIAEAISDPAIISGTSIYKDDVGHPIASPGFTLHSRPVSDEISDGYFVTNDGYSAQNSTIIDSGVLNGFLLSLYGSKKTGLERAVNDGRAFVVEPGDTSLDDMIKSVKKGILLARFSGGKPSNNGEFSGVAKNSYLIEDGEIKYPVSESMVSGNFVEAFKNIKSISDETINFGIAVYPWIAFSGLTISGK